MYEDYSRQAMPSKKYRELLGSAICVFNSNNSFVIENILRHNTDEAYNWYKLIDLPSGALKNSIEETITKNSDETIAEHFNKVVEMRNRIIHSFQITGDNGEQMLATKNKNDEQFIITEEYLYKFIKENDTLSNSLHKFRGF